MAIVQISRIQHRRGYQQDLPQLASAELGWSLDQRRLFIGNGTLEEGAPTEGVTEILTEYSDVLSLAESYTYKGLETGFQAITGPTALDPVVRPLQSKLDEIVSVRDFGAIGDGLTDDTAAIQRALNNAYATAQGTTLSGFHRTIYFPAGTYIVTSTIGIPPYTRIQGEGKRTTVIRGNVAGPIAQFVDSFGQSGANYGADNPSTGASPDTAEYHFNDLAIIQDNPALDQSCLCIDGGFTATFNRVMFRGAASFDNNNYTLYSTDRGPEIAAVCINNNSAYTGVRNLVFTQCDFLDQNYGIEINQDVIGMSIHSCYFEHLYYGIVAGKNSPDPTNYIPIGITVFDNYFSNTAGEGIYTDAYVQKFMSLGNIFTRVGLLDWESDVPVLVPNVNPPIAQFPAITFNDKNNFSIADTFERTDFDLTLFPHIETNGYDCYIVGQDRGLVSGQKTIGTGYDTTLTTTASYATAGLKLMPNAYSNLTVDYTISNATNQRTGKLKIAAFGGNYTTDDEYTETGDVGVVFQANVATGDIEYTSTGNVNLTYNLNFFS